MDKAFFVVRTGMPAGAIPTCHGPFADDAAVKAAAASFQPGSYTIYGGASAGKTFSIAAPVVTFEK